MSLSRLEGVLLALPLDSLKASHLPAATALQEAHDLLVFCQRPHIQEALVTVGQPTDFVSELELRVDAARQAQSEWVSARDRTKSVSLIALEESATALRSELLAIARYHLRGSEAESALGRVRGGDSVAELVQDLHDLAAVIEKNAGAFSRDRSFDLAARVAEARSLAERLSDGVSDERVGPEPGSTRELRDRAFSYLDDFVSEVRAAGRYAFRNQPSELKGFASRYRRRARASRAEGEGEVEAAAEQAAVTD